MVLAVKHLDFNCHLDFDIWVLVYGIAAPRQAGARSDTLSLSLRGGPIHRAIEASAFKHLDFNCHLDFGIWILTCGFGGKEDDGANTIFLLLMGD